MGDTMDRKPDRRLRTCRSGAARYGASGPVAVTNAQRRDEEFLRAAVRRRVAAGQLWEPYQEDVRMFAQEFFSFVRISNSFLTIVIWLQFWILPLDGSDGPRMEEIT